MNHDKPSPPIRVLLVEDSLHDQLAFKRALERAELPFDLTICDKAEEIQTVMQKGSDAFDMVVVDQNLPGQYGLQAYRELRRNSDLPPFIMLTGTGSETLAVEALKAGMYDYIIKDPAQGYLRLLPLKLMDVQQRHKDRRSRLKAKASLKKAHAELEKMVYERTIDLARTVEALEQEVYERKQTEMALRSSENKLRRLSRKIIESQENERKQIAKELHDSLGSALAAIKYAIEGKIKSMQEGTSKGSTSLEMIADHIHATIKEVRRISNNLRPTMLDDFGLVATVKWYCQSSGELYADTRIETKLAIDENDIPDIVKIVIYRVVQEALNNALKHSLADTIAVTLENVDGRIRLGVRDNGCGFDVAETIKSPDPLSGFGLKSMQDRADVVSGSLSFDSDPHRGTTLWLEVPVEHPR
jgi:signal transduction histidine kinase